MFTVSDLKEGKEVKVVCTVNGNRLSFDSQVEETTSNPKTPIKIITLKTVEVNGRHINFRDYPTTIEVNNNNQLYEFKVKYFKYSYNQGKMYAFIIEKDIQRINKRRACRFPCNYSVSIHLDKVSRPFTGFCRDISYVGASYLYSDVNNVITVGDDVAVDIQKPGCNVTIETSGKVVRVVPNYFNSKSLIGVDFRTANNKELDALIRDLQMEEVRKRSVNNNVRRV